MPAVHASSPARVNSNAAGSTTAAFNPVAGLLLAFTSSDPSKSFTITNNGTALTWTSIAVRNSTNGAYTPTTGCHFAVLTAGRTGMTVTATGSAGGRQSLKVYVVTDFDSADPIGAIITGSSAVNNMTTTAFVCETATALGFASGTNFTTDGVPTSADMTEDAYGLSGSHETLAGYKTLGAAGSNATFNLDAGGTTAAQWNWIAFEVRAPSASAPQEFTLGVITDLPTLYAPKGEKLYTLGTFSDAATLNALTVVKRNTLALLTDTPTLYAPSGKKLYSLGTQTDSSTLNPLSGKKPLTLTTVTDSHSLNALVAQKRASLALVANSETVNAVKAVKTETLANVTETHTLNGLTRSIGATLALITGPGTPNVLSTQKRNGLGSVTVSEVLNVLRLGRGYNLPSVTDGASLNALTGRKAATLGLATDGATFSNLAGKKLYTLGEISSTGTVQSLDETNSFSLSQAAVEIHELFPLVVQKRCSISTLTDTTTVTAPVRTKSATLGTVTGTGDVNPLGYGGTFVLGLITSSDTLFSPATSTVRHLELIESGSDLFVPSLEFDVLYAQLFGSVTQEHLVSANVVTENNSSVVLTQKNEQVRADISVATIDGSVETLMLFADAAAVVSKGGTVVTETIHGEARNA